MNIKSIETVTDVMDTVNSSDMGVWTIELYDGQKPRMIGSDKMYELLGLNLNDELSPEDVYEAWHSRILPEALPSVNESVKKMMSGVRDENTYKWMHPTLGVRYVRCGGTSTYIPGKGNKLRGYHYDVTNQLLIEDERNFVIEALAGTYLCLFYLDLRKGTYVSYNNEQPFIRDVIPDQGWISVALDNFARYLAIPEYSEKLREFTDLSTLDTRMRFKNRISCRFIGIRNRWAKVTFIASSRDRSGNLTKIIMGIRSIDDQVKEELRHAEQLQKSIDSAKTNTEYMQNLTHEIRTPLNAMYGFAQLLSLPDGCLSSSERQEYFNHIHNSFNMLSMLIDDVLDLADASHGNYRTVIERVNVNAACRNAIEMTTIRKQPEVNMYFTSDVADTFTLQSDSRRIQQLLVNYLTNACKHTMHGEIHLHVSTSETPGKLTFSVTDTGTGIPADKANAIFQRFTKLNQSVQGSGLGLNICSIIARNLGGEVKLDTTYTTGARFLFIL